MTRFAILLLPLLAAAALAQKPAKPAKDGTGSAMSPLSHPVQGPGRVRTPPPPGGETYLSAR